MDIHKKREFTLHEKRISQTMQLEFIQLFHTNPTDFRKKTAALLRGHPDLFKMNEIGTVADEHNHVSLEKFEEFLDELLKPELVKYIYQCIDEDHDEHTVTLTAITRFLSGRSKVGARAKTIIDESWLTEKLRDVDIGTIDQTGTNLIELDEFKNYFSNLKKEVPEDLVVKMFKEIDKNGDGKISTFEYFKWKEGFKQHKINQYLPAKIKKSTTQLKLMNAAFQKKHSKSVGFSDYDNNNNNNNNDNNENENKENNENKEIEILKEQILQLQQKNAEKDNQIEQLKIENNKCNKNINLLEDKIKKYKNDLSETENKSNENIKQLKKDIKIKETKMNEYESMIKTYNTNINHENKMYNNKMENDENVIKLQKLLAENEAELQMMERDKNNLFKQLEQTYEIVNDELVLDSKKNKIKTIDDAKDLRKSLKKLKSKMDVKDQKIKKYKSQKHVNNEEEKNNGGYMFTNLFVFLKDF